MSATSTASCELPRNHPVLRCRLQKKTTGRAATMPTAGEIELENTSDAVVEIEVTTSPLQYLDLIVTDAQGRRLSAFFYGDLFSPLDTPYLLRLLPGQKYLGPVSLLGNVPESEQRPGRYLIQAVYQYKELRTVSDPFLIEWPSPREANGTARPTVAELPAQPGRESAAF